MVTVIPVTGSVHAEEEEVEEVVEVVVVHVTAVLTAPPHETRLNRPIIRARSGSRLTAPLSSTSRIPHRCGSLPTPLQKKSNYIPSHSRAKIVPMSLELSHGLMAPTHRRQPRTNMASLCILLELFVQRANRDVRGVRV